MACEDLPPPKNYNPVDSGLGQELPDEPVDQEPRQKLLEAGGDLPLPDKPTVVAVSSPDSGRSWPWGPATVILLSSGLLAFLTYRLIATK